MNGEVEWQAADGSSTMHILDTSKPAWKNPDGSRRRSGPRSLCGRYPQRNAESPWLSWPAADDETAKSIALSYRLTRCPDCLDARVSLPADSTDPRGTRS